MFSGKVSAEWKASIRGESRSAVAVAVVLHAMQPRETAPKKCNCRCYVFRFSLFLPFIQRHFQYSIEIDCRAYRAIVKHLKMAAGSGSRHARRK